MYLVLAEYRVANRSAFAMSVRALPCGDWRRSATGDVLARDPRQRCAIPSRGAGDVLRLQGADLRLDAIELRVRLAHDLPAEIGAAGEGGERGEVRVIKPRAIRRALRQRNDRPGGTEEIGHLIVRHRIEERCLRVL